MFQKKSKPQEARVGVTPAGALSLIRSGHKVHIPEKRRSVSGFSDEDYQEVGCTMEPDIESVYRFAEMIIKVKEPIEVEYPLINPNQLLFTYFILLPVKS